MINFVNRKQPDYADIARILEAASSANHWANRGPVYHELASSFAEHMNVPSGMAVVPCANGGVALEAMARLIDSGHEKKRRWLASAFSFQNLGRGYFSDTLFVDCDQRGMISLAEIEAFDQSQFDGIIVVNPFGLATDFTPFIKLAERLGKHLLIDNAAGISQEIPVWPWQSFSLHHTKPFGFGEGGLAVVPSTAAEPFYALLDYGTTPDRRECWMNNGKLSDVSCAFHLSWLRRQRDWAPRHIEQAERIEEIATNSGMKSLQPLHPSVISMSRAYLCKQPVPLARVQQTKHAKFAKYYKPLRPISHTVALYENLVNVPVHPDMKNLTDDQISEDLESILAG